MSSTTQTQARTCAHLLFDPLAHTIEYGSLVLTPSGTRHVSHAFPFTSRYCSQADHAVVCLAGEGFVTSFPDSGLSSPSDYAYCIT